MQNHGVSIGLRGWGWGLKNGPSATFFNCTFFTIHNSYARVGNMGPSQLVTYRTQNVGCKLTGLPGAMVYSSPRRTCQRQSSKMVKHPVRSTNPNNIPTLENNGTAHVLGGGPPMMGRAVYCNKGFPGQNLANNRTQHNTGS